MSELTTLERLRRVRVGASPPHFDSFADESFVARALPAMLAVVEAARESLAAELALTESVMKELPATTVRAAELRYQAAMNEQQRALAALERPA